MLQKQKELLDRLTKTPALKGGWVLLLVVTGGYLVIGPVIDMLTLLFEYASNFSIFVFTKMFLTEVTKECSSGDGRGQVCQEVAGSADWSRYLQGNSVGYIWRRLWRELPGFLMGLPFLGAAFLLYRYKKPAAVAKEPQPDKSFFSGQPSVAGSLSGLASLPWEAFSALFLAASAFMFLIAVYFGANALWDARSELTRPLLEMVQTEKRGLYEQDALEEITEKERDLDEQIKHAIEIEEPEEEVNELVDELWEVRAEKQALIEEMREARDEGGIPSAEEDRREAEREMEELARPVVDKLAQAKAMAAIAFGALICGLLIRLAISLARRGK